IFSEENKRSHPACDSDDECYDPAQSIGILTEQRRAYQLKEMIEGIKRIEQRRDVVRQGLRHPHDRREIEHDLQEVCHDLRHVAKPRADDCEYQTEPTQVQAEKSETRQGKQCLQIKRTTNQQDYK